ncbi:MAG TPA: fumarate reductase/succinate dehydrogenase flavoprotein subunit, partial [Gemmatales bacterium]|nr:fumarate reductase/succinate dehydrogenase flavoprotein subunit [Gemmatales bacterium]
RLGASALMQGLADGYFILPYTLGNYFGSTKQERLPADHEAFSEAVANVQGITQRLLQVKGKQPAAFFHKKLGQLLWDHCGMARTKASLEQVLREIPPLREAFWNEVSVPGSGEQFNQSLEYAGRVADFLEFGELMALDALEREESCGGHFREEYQYPDGEAKRDDEKFLHVAAWEYQGEKKPVRHQEPLKYEEVKPTVRSYK